MTKLEELRETARKKTLELAATRAPNSPLVESAELPEEILNSPQVMTNAAIQKYGFDPYTMDNGLILNEQQRQAVDWFGIDGKSGCLIGPAGTGKTTTMKAVIRAAVLSGRIPIIPDNEEHKFLPTGVPGIWGGSFTRIATRNLRDNFPDDLKKNVHTIHRLLEFEPTIQTVTDAEGVEKKIRMFAPQRNKFRMLPSSLMLLAIDEASMVGEDLHRKLDEARNPRAQILYIGDIAQIPPVMDNPILGFKLLELPVVELTEVYRHAGVIVELANFIRTGHTIPTGKEIIPYSNKWGKMPRKFAEEAIKAWNKESDGSKVTIHLWKNRLEGDVGQLRAVQNLGLNFFPGEIKAEKYNPITDMILVPYNVGVGSLELNNYIAEFLGKKEQRIVHEVICGFEKKYLAEGDKVFFDREEAIITKINKNGMYHGKFPQKESVYLDRWGHNQQPKDIRETDDDSGKHFDSIDNILDGIDIGASDEERKNQASHVITVKKLCDFDDDGQEYKASTASEVNSILFGYALTIHKSQGSQWEKVYCVFHNSHNRNLQRELLYTAITRAKKELYVICEPETFIQGVISQHILGNSLKEKAEYFKGKQAQKDKLKALLDKANAKLNPQLTNIEET